MVRMKTRLLLGILLLPIYLLAQNWQPDYDKALLKAHDENKPLLLVFAGSDWCAPCILLDKQIWQSQEFIDYASENYVLYKADFPRKKGNQLEKKIALKNSELADKFNKKGYFPLVVVLDENEAVLGTTGYKRKEPKAYITLFNSFLK